jgi:carboxyl-terminal processing protease
MQARRVIRLLVVGVAATLIGWLVTTADFHSRPLLFESLGGGRAEAVERVDSPLARLRVLTRSVGYIRSNYVVPQRIRPRAMLLGSLRSAESLVPDLMVTPDGDEDSLRRVTVRIGDQQRVFDVSDVTDLYRMNWKLMDIYQFVARYLPSDVKPHDVEYAAINGLLSTLDEHSLFLTPDAYKEMMLDTQGRFGGLGIVITTRKGLITIVSVLEDTPADRAGFRTGDQIVEIGDESTMNMSLTDAVTRLRGEPQTKVTVLVQRKEWLEPRSFALTRDEIRVQSVTHEDLGNGIGYVRIRNFQEDTALQLERRLDALGGPEDLKGIVLDLRQDPGGLLDQAVMVSNLFLSEGVLVVTEGEGKRMRQVHMADGDAPYASVPLVVLVDGGSASAAEIVAGALRNNDRAPLIGSTTFGKGTVQVLYEIEDGIQGALKLTVAQYLTPGDISIQGVGVSPDIEMLPVSVGTELVTMGIVDSRRPRDPKRSLEAFGEVSVERPVARRFYLLDEPEASAEPVEDDDEPPIRDDQGFKRDAIVELGEILAQRMGSPSRLEGLRLAGPAIEEWAAGQDGRIAEKLSAHGVDWTAGAAVKDAPVRVSWSIDRPQPLRAGEKVLLRLSARNTGSEPLYRVHCATESDNGALDGREFVFGKLDPGQVITREVGVRIPPDSWDRKDQIRFHLYQDLVEGERPPPEVVRIRGLPRPRFAYTVQVLDDGGNRDGILSPGESASVRVDIRNIGTGPARKMLVTLRNKSGDGVYLREGRVNIPDGIPPGGTAHARFRLELRPELAAGDLKLEVGILDLELREALGEELVFPVLKSTPGKTGDLPGTLRVIHDGMPVLTSVAADAQIIYNLPEGFILRSLGRIGDFHRIETGPERFAFVRANDVALVDKVMRFSVLPDVPLPMFVEPGLDVSFDTEASPEKGGLPVLVLKGEARYAGREGEARRKVLVYRGSEKVYFWTRKGPTNEAVIGIDTRVTLTEGQNDITIFAIEGTARSAVRRYSVFIDSVPPGRAEGPDSSSLAGGVQ